MSQWRNSIFIISLLTLFLFQGALAQEKSHATHKRNRVRLLGGSFGQKEENLHPKVHAGIGVQLSYLHSYGSGSVPNLEVYMNYCRPSTDFEDLSATVALALGVKYAVAPIRTRFGAVRLRAGPVAHLHYDLTYYPNWDESHYYWANYFSLGLQNFLRVKAGRSSTIDLSLELPIAGIFSRPDPRRLQKFDDLTFGGIVGNLHGDLQPGWWGNMFYLNFVVEYCFDRGGRFAQSLIYSFNYTRMNQSDGLPFQKLSHSIGLGFAW